MIDRFAAFLSYASPHRAWVRSLHEHLEAGLRLADQSVWRIFLDALDLSSGGPWLGEIQAALDRAEHLILVITPETFASPRVTQEWQSFLAVRLDWRKDKVHLVNLLYAPLPPFLEVIQSIDFSEGAEAAYRLGLQVLLAGLLGHGDLRSLPPLPADLVVPKPPDIVVPSSLRRRIVDWLTPRLRDTVLRAAIAHWLDLETSLEGHPSWACAASAALVKATRGVDPLAAAHRMIETLVEKLQDSPDQIAELIPIREELRTLRSPQVDGTLLASWLHLVASDHEELAPYFQHHAAIEVLDRVYVQLELLPRTASERPSQRFDRPLTLREVLGLRRPNPHWATGRWVLLGDPGAGKTTLLRHFAANLARQPDAPWVPLFESLPMLVQKDQSPFDRAALRMKRVGQSGRAVKRMLEDKARQGRLLMLLDGLDELPRKWQEDALRLLRDLDYTWPEMLIVVTSRFIGYRRPSSAFLELELLPLDAERQLEFLVRWFGRGTQERDEKRAREALARLNHPELSQLAGNPLYLTLMALLFEQGQPPDLDPTRLYEQVFELLLAGKHRFDGRPIQRQDLVRRALRHIALGMTRDNRDAEPRRSLEERLYHPEALEIRKAIADVPRWHHLQVFFDDVERTGILAPHDGIDTDWRFWHGTFREALVTEQLLELYSGRADGLAQILTLARKFTSPEHLNRWAQPFTLLAGRIDRPEQLIGELLAVNRPLGLRALAATPRLQEDALRKTLQLMKLWQERREVYLQLPKLVGDPGRVLALLDQLRRSTRNGNDLFAIDLVAQQVGSTPELAQALSSFRTTLYDHIPPPPEALFRRVNTPCDGEVPLWAEIKPGQFRMGSPEEEELQRFEEQPQHAITMVRSFGCCVVPVTNAQYGAFDPQYIAARTRGATTPADLGGHPVVGITWYEAISFCRWLSSALPWTRGVRLPVEEEWEYACRAGTDSSYWSGQDVAALASVGWYNGNATGRAHQVGKKPANPWGLYDLHGNV